MKFKTVLITGGSGFLGSHLIDAFVEISDKVVSVDKKTISEFNKNKNAFYRWVDIQDEEAVNKLFKKIKPDLVIHLAAHNHDRGSIKEPVLNANQNILGSLNVFNAANKNNCKRVVFSSTGVVYGNQNGITSSETIIPKPLTPYAISKFAGEEYLRFFHEVHGLSSVSLRIGNIYGARQDIKSDNGVVGVFAAKLLRGEQAYIYNDGSTIRDYIYILDAVQAFIKASESGYSGSINIGSGKSVSTLEMYRLVQSIVGVEIEPEYREEIGDVVHEVRLNVDLAKNVLDWKAKITLEDGVLETVEWYRKNA